MSLKHVIKKTDITSHQFVPHAVNETTPLSAGQALVKLELFALSAGNITYAQSGARLGYWNFFSDPADTEYGRSPVWGFGEVVQAAGGAVPAGTKLFGFFPIATYHVLTLAADAADRGVYWEVSPHRAAQPAIYNQYRVRPAGPAQAPQYAVYYPLFLSGYLFESQQLRGAARGKTVVMLCASSRTAVCLATRLRDQQSAARVLGVTSARHRDYVVATGLYDAVVTYDDVLGGHRFEGDGGCVLVDFSGATRNIRAVQTALGPERCAMTLLGGRAAWDAPPEQEPLPLPVTMLNAPALFTEQRKEIGAQEFERRFTTAYRDFLENGLRVFRLERKKGPEAVMDAFRRLFAGEVEPDEGLVFEL